MSLYEKLPAVYRLEDAKQNPPFQLKALIESLEHVFAEVHEDIEGLYHNFFIDTCEPWVIPYIGDLVGASHLAGDAKTLRADVAETVALRRRKGTRESIDRLTTALTGWPSRVVELREQMAWNQNLNHFRPDAGGDFPEHPRGGTLSLRDPAPLAYISTPLENVSRTADLKPRLRDEVRWNLPNVAVYLWRTRLFQIQRADPGFVDIQDYSADLKAIRVVIHPLGRTSKGRPLRLFSETGPLMRDDLTSLVAVNSPQSSPALHIEMKNAGHGPWLIQGADLCRWGEVKDFALAENKVLVDPKLGKIVIGVKAATVDDAKNIAKEMMLSYWVGAPAAVGGLPESQKRLTEPWTVESQHLEVHRADGVNALQTQLMAAAATRDKTTVIEIADSGTYILDFAKIPAQDTREAGHLSLQKSILIRAAADMRPVILLKSPMKFRPVEIVADPPSNEDDQKRIDLENSELNVRWEGILFGRHEEWQDSDRPLCAALALNQIEFVHCTLDPGGFKWPNENRAPAEISFEWLKDYGLDTAIERQRLKQQPRLRLEKSICGAIRAGASYHVEMVDSIVDGGEGTAVNSPDAESSALDPSQQGPHLEVHGATVLGACQGHSIFGEGGVFSGLLSIWDTQKGCLSQSTYLQEGSRLPRVHGCFPRVSNQSLRFSAVTVDAPAYGQLSRNTTHEILEQGPPREGSYGDQMGAYGFQMETQKWKNLEIRLREYSPVGSVLLMVPVPDFYS